MGMSMSSAERRKGGTATASPNAMLTLAGTDRPLIQRRCACGGAAGKDGDCEECRGGKLQTKAARADSLNLVPPIVHEVLRSPGQPLDARTRSVLEPRFGHHFEDVRVHSGDRAAASADAIGALAYTLGSNVVFGAGQYKPGTTHGTKLIAHELAHVIQQRNWPGTSEPSAISSPSDTLEQEAERTSEQVLHNTTAPRLNAAGGVPPVSRAVGRVNCPPNVFGASADPDADLQAVDPVAVDLATQAATSFAADATAAAGGVPAAPSATFQSYQDHFGLPNAVGGGFLNRLTGVVRPSLAVAMGEELRILSRRFQLVARFYTDRVNYACPGAGAATLGTCTPTTCAGADAFSCRGSSTIALCQGFWGFGSNDSRAAILIHEAAHVIWGPTGLNTPGEIGDDAQRGPGGNFNVAGCYEFIVDDMAGIDSGQGCPPVPAA